MKKFLYIFILLFIVGWAQAQQRVVYTICLLYTSDAADEL